MVLRWYNVAGRLPHRYGIDMANLLSSNLTALDIVNSMNQLLPQSKAKRLGCECSVSAVGTLSKSHRVILGKQIFT